MCGNTKKQKPIGFCFFMPERGNAVMKKHCIRPVYWIIGALLAALPLLRLWQLSAEAAAYYAPPVPMADLAPLLAAEQPHYKTLFLQTGLGAPALDALWDTPDGKQAIMGAQQSLYRAPDYFCAPNSAVSREEHTSEPVTKLVNIEDGDILVTPCSHTYGWRNGHAALVIDAAAGLTLESVVLGEDSCVQTLDKWTKYPQFAVLRVTEATAQTRSAVARWAAEQLAGRPYNPVVGLLTDKENAPESGTQCAHLVWRAYAAFGYDLDADGGGIVTPRDLWDSPQLSVVQAYGTDLTALAARLAG